MKVIAGKLKGKPIPFSNNRFDNANTTPQKVKEALFSTLNQDLSGKHFLDLYACSGQIGIEAISRDAELVVFNEIDPKRYRFIKTQIQKLDIKDKVIIFNFHAFRCLRYIDSKKIQFDYIYVDPPYYKTNDRVKPYYDIIKELGRYSLIKQGGKIIIQHSSDIGLDESIGKFVNISRKKYSKNTLSIYACL